ncbi:MAG: T9SS type A sorting domain-containing protein [Bacteroidota bacterium]|nr:T9SS type A sorting domain-containing protein [Bacteroidota bacterium]
MGNRRPVTNRSWRPIVAAALGLLSISVGASAQNRAFPKPQAAERVARPLSAAPVTVQPIRTIVSRQVLSAISSTAAGGNWSAPATWVGGVVPTAADDVTIVAGATVTLDVAAAAASLTIAATGSLLTSATTAYQLQVAGSVTNNGTLDLSNSATIGSDLRFTGAGDVAFAGTGTTDLQTVTLAKSVRADVVDMTLPAFTVQGGTPDLKGFLLTRTTGTTPVDDMTGTLKISGTATISARVFGSAASYIIPATGGFWLNNPNYTVVGQTGSPSVAGSLRISAGTYNVGSSIGNSISFTSGAVYTQDGGTLNTAGRFGSFTSASAAAAMTFTLSAGTLNVATVGNTSGTPSFGVNGTNTVSGGTINLVQRSTATTPLDYYVAGTYNFTGGTVNVGTAATATNFDFRIRGSFPNLTIDNTTNPKSALLQGQTNVYGTVLTLPGTNLNLNGQLLLQLGTTITNNGILTGTTTGSTIYFAGSVPQTLGGSGTFTTIRTITVDNNGGGATLNVPVVTTRVNLFTGNLNGTSNLTIGDGTAIFFVIQIGVTGNTNTSGSLTSAPVFNLGSGALQLIYAPELTARTTGFEIPATRIVDAITVSNPAGVILAGGNLLVNASGVSTGSLTLSSGILTTSAGNVLTLGTAAATIPTGSATSYVKGPLGITVNSATAVSRTFAVGDAAGWRPVVVSGITTSADQVFTATVLNGATGGTGGPTVSSLNPTRYVRIQNTANLPATARVQLSYGADDVLGAPATTVVAQAATAAGTYASLGGAAATTPTTGIVSAQDLTPGSDYFVLANTEGGTLASSAAAVCAGTNSGTLTLSGNAGTITGYQADSGSGFVTLAGTNTGSTYTFANLTTTTTFRTVIMTADNRTVYSAPVTVTVNPAPTATLTAGGPTTFCAGGSVVLTATAGTGNTYQFFNGTTSLGAASATNTLTAAAAGSYTVVVTNASTCSATSAATTVTVNPATTATFSYSGSTYCASGTNPTPTVTGTAGGTFASTTGLSLNATTGAINLAASTLGTYTVTYSVGGSCPSSATASVTVTSAPSASFSYAQPSYCAGSTGTIAPAFGTNSSGGAFSASPAGLTVNATTGAITLASSTAGTYTVTNTIAASGGCASATATATVTINALPTATLTAGSATTFCAGGSVVLTAAAGTGNTYQFFNGTTSLGTASATNTFTASATGSYTVVVNNASGCVATSTATTVTVNPATTATFSYSGSTYCASGTNPAATVTGTAGGTFASTTGLSLSATTGAINLSASTPGTYTVTYSVGGPCASSATASVTITAAPVAAFSYANAAYCASATNPAPVVPATSTAGAFSSTTGLVINATTGVINLATSTAGVYTVTNTVAAAGGCAQVTATTQVTINAATTATFSYSGATYCVSGTNPTATVTGTAGGAFASTTGLSLDTTTGAINLSASTPGTYTVTYSVGGPCASSATTSVTITAAPVAAFSYANAAYCASATNPAPVVPATSTAGAFSSTTGLVINATTGVINLATSTAGVYTVTNTVAAAGGCATATATTQVTINARPATPTLSAQYNGPTTTLTSSSATGNQFYLNGTLITGATGQTYVVNSTAQYGPYTVVVTNANGCASLPSTTITVTSALKPLAGSSLSVFPNPTRDGKLNVELTGYRQAVELTVLNALGQLVFTGTVPASTGTTTRVVDLSQLPTGIYILRAKTEGGLDTRRLVRE